MIILDALKADHDTVKSLLKAILETEDGKKRNEPFKHLKIELTAHSRSEEKVFYRRLEKTDEGKDEALEGDVEHEVADRLVEDLSRSRNKASETWTARCTVLQELLRHHIDEEESAMFASARKLFDRATLEKMGAAFAAEKVKHGGTAAEKVAAE